MKAFPKTGASSRAGFTLIELLVAATILTMIFTIVFGTFFYTIENAEEQQARAALYHRASFILNNISQGVSSACVPFAGLYFDENSDKSVFSGTGDPLGDFEADALSAFTTNPRFGDRKMEGDIAYVTYEVTQAGDVDAVGWFYDENNPLALKCTVEPLLLDSERAGGTEPQWTLNIRSLNFEYFDGDGWLEEWNYEDQGMLPDAVRIELELADSGGGSHLFSTTAFVQVNGLLEEPLETGAEEEEEREEQQPEETEEGE